MVEDVCSILISSTNVSLNENFTFSCSDPKLRKKSKLRKDHLAGKMTNSDSKWWNVRYLKSAY